MKLGIVAAGSIVKDFLRDTRSLASLEVSALYSRTRSRAESVCLEFSIPLCVDSLAGLFPHCDALYIASPNSAHYAQSKEALEAGKHVLCEKPICLSLGQYEELLSLSRQKGLVFMEAQRLFAMKSFQKVQEIVKNKTLGDIYSCEISLGSAGQRLDRRTLELGGGSLMDLGVYALFAFTQLFGMPLKMCCFSRFYHTGVDAYTGIHLSTKETHGVLSASFAASARGELRLMGTEGTLVMPKVFSEAQKLILTLTGVSPQEILCPQGNAGLASLTEDFIRYTHGENLDALKRRSQAAREVLFLADKIRQNIGLIYP